MKEWLDFVRCYKGCIVKMGLIVFEDLFDLFVGLIVIKFWVGGVVGFGVVE